MYKDLNINDKARIIQLAVKSGITDLKTIEEVYNNKYAEGGDLLKTPIDTEEIKNRQEFMESGFLPRIKPNKKGAIGRFQVREPALKEYINATGDKGDLTDSIYNEKVRDWYFNERLNNSAFITKGNPSDSVIVGKKLASYNYGPTNTVNALNKAKAAGIDIYNSFDWLDYMPDETKDYINFILRGKDINIFKNNLSYNAAKKFYEGGNLDKNYLYKDGGFIKESDKLYKVWEARTGIPFSQVDKYVSRENKSTKENLKILRDLNLGKYDYLKTKNSTSKDLQEQETLIDTITNKLNNYKQLLINPTDKKNRYLNEDNINPKPLTWSTTDIGTFISKDSIKSNIFDFSQHGVPNEKHKVFYPRSQNPKKQTKSNEEWCAEYLTNKEMDRPQNVEYTNFRGDAWTWLQNTRQSEAFKRGDATIDLNIYKQGFGTFTGNESKEEIIKRTQNISKTKSYKDILKTSLHPGSIVTILNPASNMFSKAAESFKNKKGETLSTHIGEIIERNGKLYLRDNIGDHTSHTGTVYERPLDDILNGKSSYIITGVANYGFRNGSKYTDISEFPNFTGYSPNLYSRTQVSSDAMYRALSAIYKNKEAFAKNYGIGEKELSRLSNIAAALIEKESGAGTSPNYYQEMGHADIAELAKKAGISNLKNFQNWVQGKGINPISLFTDSIKLGIHTGTPTTYYDKKGNPIYVYNKDTKNLARVALGALKPTLESVEDFFNIDNKALKFAESKGLSNIKYLGDDGNGKALFTKDELKKIGISDNILKNRELMESPEVSGIMTILALKKKESDIKEKMIGLPDKYTKDKELIEALTIQSWNQGIKNISKNIEKAKQWINNSKPELADFELYQYFDMNYYKDTNEFRNYSNYGRDLATKIIKDKVDISTLPKEDIKNLQKYLVNEGYLRRVINGTNQIDGIIGKNTKRAIQAMKDSTINHSYQIPSTRDKIFTQDITNSSLPIIKEKIDNTTVNKKTQSVLPSII